MFLGFLKLFVLSIILLKYGALASNDSWTAKVRCIKREREALLHFKAALGNNPSHFAWSSWDSNRDCCEWEGVICSNKTGHVLMLHLAGDDDLDQVVSGQISASLMELKSLMYLNLSFNEFEDSYIPQSFGYLTNLRYLDLRYCFIRNSNIPSQLGNLPHLQYLDLSNNFLEGLLPYQIGNLPQLQYLNIQFNFLGGPIPHQLGNLSQLQHLDLSRNFFEGAIPHQLGNLLHLRHLDLLYTNLGGVIPCQLGNLSNLERLFLGGSGTLKIGRKNSVGVEWLSSLTSLTLLQLSNVTDLTYSPKWLQGIAKLPSLKELRISDSNVSDKYILSLPSLKFNSSSLSVLDLSYNNFMSSTIFYWISNVSSNLFELDFSSNFLMGPIPYEFGRTMNSLETLDLSDNQLKGELKSLANMTSLRSFYSQNNQITGTLSDLSPFTSLETIDISGNLLNGTIPKDLRFPSSLRYLSLDSNSLRGVLTDYHFDNLHNLKFLDLSGNSLALSFSHNWVPHFQLQHIYLRSCRLGPSFPKWLLTQKSFTALDISNAGIMGAIPKCFWDQLTPELKHLNLSCNNISGMVPNVPTTFVDNDFISLAYNNFEGPIPQFLRNINALILSNNKFSEIRPVLCESGATAAMIALLDLSNNQLSGPLPDCWANFKSLSILILRNNRFIGELPLTLKSCSSLLLLDAGGNKFSGPISPWIGMTLHNLEMLTLRNNTFSGNLSMHLCYLSRIRFLDISLNNISGKIPKCFDNLTAMAEKSFSYLAEGDFPEYISKVVLNFYNEFNTLLEWKGTERHFVHHIFLKGIDLSSNQLTGRIPAELVNIVDMTVLNLSRNQLDGKIPSKIGRLTSLESLDLSRNHLFGPIPSSLAHIDRLAMLDLSHNNLSGNIPIGTQLQSFDSSSYEGNLDLCGKPLEKMCPKEGKHQEELVKVQEDKPSVLSKEFYWGMALGFVIGFWAIFGSILFIQSWRHAYFRFLSNLSDTIYVMVILNTTKCNMWLRGYLERLR